MKAGGFDLLYSVNIRLVADESLGGLATSNVPQLSGGITGARDENVLVWTER